MLPRTARKTAIIWLLLFATALWGTAVAAHQHLETDHGLCDIAQLPHAGSVAPVAVEVVIAAPGPTTVVETRPGYFPAHRAPYQSRGPPA